MRREHPTYSPSRPRRGSHSRTWVARCALAVPLAAALPHAARADGVVEELSAGASGLAGWVSNKLAGTWDVDPQWQLGVDLSATRTVGDSSGGTYVGSLSAVFSPDEHWSLRFNGGWSPALTGTVTAAVPIDGLPEDERPDAQLCATASWFVLGVGVDYAGAVNDVHSASVSLSLGETYFHTHQEVVSVPDWTGRGGGTLSAMQAQILCRDTMCDQPGLFLPQSAELGQFAVNASVTDTVDRDTDFSVDASYYLYGDDPDGPGYLALKTLTTDTRASATSTPLLRAALAPSVTHRWGDLSTRVGLSYTSYAVGDEIEAGASLSVQYPLPLTAPRRLVLDARLEASKHRPPRTPNDPEPAITSAYSAALGVQYTW